MQNVLTPSSDYIHLRHSRVDNVLDRFLPSSYTAPYRLHQAMRYVVLNTGKRLRPLLVYAAGETFNGPLENLDIAACAVEFIHASSLVHDDLPAMDDDDFRRGKLSCHRAFDEATAILVGDSLLTLPFEIIANEKNLLAETRLQMISVLANASGHQGMVGGQAMEFELKEKNIETLEKIHRLKTGALIRGSIQLGAIAANVTATEMEPLEIFANAIGLAFQIQDDINDKLADETQAGYLDLTDMESAKQRVKSLYQEALRALDGFGEKANPLRYLADYMIVIK